MYGAPNWISFLVPATGPLGPRWYDEGAASEEEEEGEEEEE